MKFFSSIKEKLFYKIGSLVEFLSSSKISIWRTLFTNFYFLPFNQARRLPIFVYGKLKFLKCRGSIVIDCPLDKIYRGMIRLNENLESTGAPGADMVIALGWNTKIVFCGTAFIGHNSKILLWGRAVLRLGTNSRLGLNCNIACCNSIEIGENVGIGSEVQLFDTNCHFSYKVSEMKVYPYDSPIVIGNNCWIGSRTTIMKGVVLANYTSVAANSVVNKSVCSDERILIGGIPAKLLRKDYTRIFNKEIEWEIAGFFIKNPQAEKFTISYPLERYN